MDQRTRAWASRDSGRPRAGDWLDDEIADWKFAGVTDVVSLLEDHETARIERVASQDISCGTEYPRTTMDARRVSTVRRLILERSVFFDLFGAEEEIELEGRATLLRGLAQWLANSGMTPIEAAKALGTSPARVAEIKRGRLSRFDLNALFRLAAKAGLHPTVQLAGGRFGPKSGAKRRAGRGIG